MTDEARSQDTDPVADEASTWVELNAVRYQYVRYGDETTDGASVFSQPCHLCSCLPGAMHAARCPMGGGRPHERPITCRDCGTPVGRWHVGGCGIEQCPACGGQYAS
ncbi:MAG: hypothetical protein JWN99_999 [Ilumatobacteraceae bacterium]|nr:hypothetical protein [Ilumatobacteraceae bacterium]